METAAPRSTLHPEHFLGALAIGMEDGAGLDCRGWSRVRPEMFAPATDRVRIGFLTSMVDLVAGNPPWGPVYPTLDLRVQVVTRPPAHGRIRLDCRTLRATRTMYWSETLLCADHGETPFARATSTFRNTKLESSPLMRSAAPEVELDGPIEDRFGLERVAPGVVLVAYRDEIGNPAVGTIQGGAQATIAEMAAEDALLHGTGRRHCVVDLDIRYVDRLRVGPMLATATILPGHGPTAAVTVICADAGDGGRVVSHVSMLAATL